MGDDKPPADEAFIHTALNDGQDIILRRITPNDGELLREGIRKLSSESRYLRFFSPAPMVPDAVVDRLVDVDGDNHIAWGALCVGCEDGPPMGAVHAVRHQPASKNGEYSVAVIDDFHGQGVARMLSAALFLDCRNAGITYLDVQILSENRGAAALIRSMGAQRQKTEAGVSDFTMDIETAISALQADSDVPGLRRVFTQFRAT